MSAHTKAELWEQLQAASKANQALRNELSSLAASAGSAMLWVPVRDGLPEVGVDALINHRDGTPEFGLIELAERTEEGWRIIGGLVEFEDVSHYAVIKSPNCDSTSSGSITNRETAP